LGVAPGVDNGWLALARAPDWALQAEANGFEQPRDMRRMIADPKGSLDDQANAGARPDLAAQAVGFGPTSQ